MDETVERLDETIKELNTQTQRIDQTNQKLDVQIERMDHRNSGGSKQQDRGRGSFFLATEANASRLEQRMFSLENRVDNLEKRKDKPA